MRHLALGTMLAGLFLAGCDVVEVRTPYDQRATRPSPRPTTTPSTRRPSRPATRRPSKPSYANLVAGTWKGTYRNSRGEGGKTELSISRSSNGTFYGRNDGYWRFKNGRMTSANTMVFRPDPYLRDRYATATMTLTSENRATVRYTVKSRRGGNYTGTMQLHRPDSAKRVAVYAYDVYAWGKRDGRTGWHRMHSTFDRSDAERIKKHYIEVNKWRAKVGKRFVRWGR